MSINATTASGASSSIKALLRRNTVMPPRRLRLRSVQWSTASPSLHSLKPLASVTSRLAAAPAPIQATRTTPPDQDEHRLKATFSAAGGGGESASAQKGGAPGRGARASGTAAAGPGDLVFSIKCVRTDQVPERDPKGLSEEVRARRWDKRHGGEGASAVADGSGRIGQRGGQESSKLSSAIVGVSNSSDVLERSKTTSRLSQSQSLGRPPNSSSTFDFGFSPSASPPPPPLLRVVDTSSFADIALSIPIRSVSKSAVIRNRCRTRFKEAVRMARERYQIQGQDGRRQRLLATTTTTMKQGQKESESARWTRVADGATGGSHSGPAAAAAAAAATREAQDGELFLPDHTYLISLSLATYSTPMNELSHEVERCLKRIRRQVLTAGGGGGVGGGGQGAGSSGDRRSSGSDTSGARSDRRGGKEGATGGVGKPSAKKRRSPFSKRPANGL